MADNPTTRRAALRRIATGAGAIFLTGTSAGQQEGRRTGPSNRFARLVSRHGPPSIEEISVMDEGRILVEGDGQAEYMEFLREQGYSTGQVERASFGNNHVETVVSGTDGDQALVSMHDTSSIRGSSSQGVSPQAAEAQLNITDERISDSQEQMEERRSEIGSRRHHRNGRRTHRDRSPNTKIASSAVPTTLSPGGGISFNFADDGWDAIFASFPVVSPALATHDESRGLVGAAVSTRVLAYQAGGEAEVYKNVSCTDNGTVRVNFTGEVRGLISAIIASANVECDIFMRESGGGNETIKRIIDLSDALSAQSFTINYDQYNTGPGGDYGSLLYDVEAGGEYEIGARIYVASTAFSTSSAVVNFYPNSELVNADGYFDYDSINISYE